MEQYISKSALVAEIERRLDEIYGLLPNASKVENGTITISEGYNTGKYTALESFNDYIDTLEVKEVDLEKEINAYMDNEMKFLSDEIGYDTFSAIAKHFFELGVNTSNLLNWEDIANINDIVSEIIKECDDNILYDTKEDFCKEVLKRFKAQKGEKV